MSLSTFDTQTVVLAHTPDVPTAALTRALLFAFLHGVVTGDFWISGPALPSPFFSSVGWRQALR